MAKLSEAEMIAKYDAERSGQLYLVSPMTNAPTYTPVVQVEQRSTDDKEPTTWTDFTCGAVHVGSPDSDGNPADLIIHGREVTNTPITYALLSALYADLSALLAHPGVQAALPMGETPDPKDPPCATTRVRVRSFTNDCSFPLLLSFQVGLAIERQRATFGLTEDQVWKLLIIAGEAIDDAFDLPAGLMLTDTDRLADVAYKRGYKEAIADIGAFARSLGEQRESEKAD